MKGLFELETECISLDDLKKADFDFFKNGYLLDDCYNSTIFQYYNVFYKSVDIVPFYHCIPSFNTVTKDKAFRFLIVDIDGVPCFIAYKIIQIIKTKQIRVFDIPIALNGDIENSRKVFNLLHNKTFVRFAMSDYSVKLLNLCVEKKIIEYTNYYYTRQKTELIPNKKKKHYGVNVLKENKDFQVLLLDKISTIDARNIVDDFNKYIVERGSTISAKDNNEFCAFCNGYENIKLMCIYYKNILISITVLYVFGNVAYNLYQKDLKHYDKYDSVLNKMLRFYMEQKTKLLCFNFLEGVERIYILGCMPSEKRLIEHKERCSDGKIEYYIY